MKIRSRALRKTQCSVHLVLPTTMAFGDVPPALETGVIDGLLTNLGGFNRVKDQAPFFTVAGINGIVGDYYWIGAANKWWNKLNAEQQGLIAKIIAEDAAMAEESKLCNDKRLIDKYGPKPIEAWYLHHEPS